MDVGFNCSGGVDAFRVGEEVFVTMEETVILKEV